MTIKKIAHRIANVCVIGDSGFVGLPIVHRLHDAAYNVRVPTRREECAKALLVFPGVEVFEANAHDPQAMISLYDVWRGHARRG